MTEENTQSERGENSNQLAAALALSGGALDPRAAEYLHKQSRIADLQIADLERENRLRHWSLRFGNVSAVMKVSFEVALAFVMLTIAVVVGTAVWNAAHDDGLVIEAFNVPADMTSKGLSGQVIATQVQDRIAWMQSHADTIRAANTFRSDWGNDIKVQIPDTGVSIGEAYRSLAEWLGHETRITGEVWHDPKGIAISARAGDEPAKTFHAPESELDTLVTKAAEYVYGQTQPYRYTVFLDQQGRLSDALAATRALALNGSPQDKAWAYSRWGTELHATGDFRGALEKQRAAESLNPDLPHVADNVAQGESDFGHDEAALRFEKRALALLESPKSNQLAPDAVAIQTLIETMFVAEATGDFKAATEAAPKVQPLPDYDNAHLCAPIMMSADLARMHDIAGSFAADRGAPNDELEAIRITDSGNTTWYQQPMPKLMRAVALGDWKAAHDDLVATGVFAGSSGPSVKPSFPLTGRPWLAYADAKLADFSHAEALIEKTPRDCYLCVEMRGNIRAEEKEWGAANFWFAEAARQAPSIPFAYADWGAMLKAKGDYDAAIEKFHEANLKGPHFADPLEMWGEALMLKNRSDLALAKFEEADRYAPNWGRLHLKWGEALFYAGHKDDARLQYQAASGGNLSVADKTELARRMAQL